MSQEMLFEIADGVATITINRPERRNAFTDAMVIEWVELIEESARRDDVRVALVTGAGSAFTSGGDVGGFAEKAAQSPLMVRERMTRTTQSLVRAVAAFDKPMIAAVNGLATGGGMDVALMCDVRLAAASARFAETYAKMGLLPGMGGTWFLPRVVGTAAALDLFWTARWVDAEEALRLGIVNRVFSDDSFRDEVRSYAQQIARAAPLSVRFIKRLTYGAMHADLDSHLDALATNLALVRTSDDHREAVAAFQAKRAPNFTGR